MSLFFETIKIKNFKILNLKQHNKRLNYTIDKVFDKKSNFDISDFVKIPDSKCYRCKVIYDTKICSVELLPYNPREFNSFKIIHTDIEYPYKSVDRDEIDRVFKQREFCDDIIIVKDSLVCDTSIANIAIYDGLKWYTPKKPLLYGTQRAKLLEDKIIVEKEIKVKDFKNIVSFAIMNALLGFKIVKDVQFRGL